MKSIVTIFNNLQGEYSKEYINELISFAKEERIPEIANRLQTLLEKSKSYPNVNILHVTNPIVQSEFSALYGIEEDSQELCNGLGKAVSPDDIYQMVTDKIIGLIESGEKLPWQEPWISVEKYGFMASNFINKKPYRGINALLLNPEFNPDREPFDIPYFLTFNQIQEKKGRLKKGAKGYKVVYFTKVYTYSQDNEDGKISFKTSDHSKFVAWAKRNKNKISILKEDIGFLGSFINNHSIPILKYYNVFNADDIDGIDWGISVLDPKKEAEKIEVADDIIKSYPNPPSIEQKGDKDAYYSSKADLVVTPPKTKYSSIQKYYGILFHELIHSTGHESRLHRKLGNKFGSAEYSFEELIAELGASFLNAETGILYHNIKNSASYLKGWKNNLKAILKEDNRFFFRASSKAQAAADYILDRDKKGLPAYQKEKKPVKPANKARSKQQKPSAKVEAVAKKATTTPKVDEKTGQLSLLGVKAKKVSKKPNYAKNIKAALDTEIKQNMKSGAQTELEAVTRVQMNYQTAIENGEIYAPDLKYWQKAVDDLYKRKIKLLAAQKNSLGSTKEENKLYSDNKLVYSLDGLTEKVENTPKSHFDISGPVSEFYGEIERKPVHSVAITLDAPQGSGKTRKVFQDLNEFARNGYKCLFVSLEEHPESDLFQSKVEEYIGDQSRSNIAVVGELPNWYDDLAKLIPHYDVIAIDSWNKVAEKSKGIDFDNDLRKKYHGKLFICIFQRTTNGTMRGGSKAAFDGDIICKIVKTDNFKENYVMFDKNRYQSKDLESLKYSIYHQKLIPAESNCTA
ncbi:MAG: zincin-like metallopeptidase domain-containing protein [Putridiphycobacter sp.]|nr:zincin-like metallopeptidase domain-containing protein [Putridiphycobacter sp.]